MSWLIKTLRSNDPQESTSPPAETLSGGVKEDLSVIGQTIGRQLRGVAAFLAPPPPNDAAESSPESEALAGIRNDLVEIGGSFKSGFTLLSSNSNRAVSEISRFASNLLQLQDKAEAEEEEEDDDDDDDGYGYGYGDGSDGVPGITDEVLQFVTEISKRPELWTHFPLQLNHGNNTNNILFQFFNSYPSRKIVTFIEIFYDFWLHIICNAGNLNRFFFKEI